MNQIRMQLTVSGQDIDAYVARTRDQRALGLMECQFLAPGEGMLFVCDKLEVQKFWMKDTPLPLSIAFLAEDGTILHIDDMEPQTLDATTCEHPVRYVLEMGQGWFEERGVAVGAQVEGPVFVPELSLRA